MLVLCSLIVYFFKQKTAYELRISDWSSDVCSSDLALFLQANGFLDGDLVERVHAHLDVGEVDARAVGLHPRLHVEIDDPLHGDQQLHARSFSFTSCQRRLASMLRLNGSQSSLG